VTGDSQKVKGGGMTLIISVGRWGGFYCHSHRLCLGWIAFTLYSFDIDDILQVLTDHYWKSGFKTREELISKENELLQQYRAKGQ
jgi:hypothetical protein